MVGSYGRDNGSSIEQQAPSECRLGGEVLWAEQGVVDKAGATKSSPAEFWLGGEVLREEQGLLSKQQASVQHLQSVGLVVESCGRRKGSLIE